MTGISDGGNGVTYNASFANTAISGSKLISLKQDDGTLLDTIALLDVTDGLGGGTFLANSLHTNRGLTNSFTPTTLPLTASFFDSNGTEYQKSALITPSFNGTVDKMKISTATGDSEITLTANDGDGGSITLGDTTATTTKDLTVNATFIDPNTSKTTSVSETFFIVSDGRDGTSARSVRLTTDAQVFVEALDGTVTPSSIAFTAIRQNISGSSTFNTNPSVTLTGAGDSRALSATNFGSNTSVLLSVSASEDGEFTDEVRIVRVKEGTDGLTLISSNPAHTLPASSSGEVLDYANSGTTLSLFEGATQLDYDDSGTTAGHWSASVSQSPTSTITVGTITDSTNDAVVGVHSAMDDDTDTVAITYTITGKRLNGDAISLTNVQTLTKSKEGLDSIQVSNDNSNHTFTCDTAGTPTSFAGSGTNIQVFEGVTALTFTTSTVSAGKYSVSISNESGLTEGTASGNNTTTCVIGVHSGFTASQATITYTISGQRLDGTAFTLTTTQTLTKSIQGEDGTIGQDGSNAIDITPSLFTQNLIRDVNNGDTFDTVSNITISAQETGSALTAIAGGGTLTNSSFQINSSITNGSEASAGVITPSQPSSASNPGGLTTTYTIDYKDGSGNVGSREFNHPITTTVVGTNGPGVVFTGVWEASRAYQFSSGASGRRDVVLWSSSGNTPYDTYYATKETHTSAGGNVANGAPHQSSANKWESLGTQDFFVAAKIGLFEDSFVQNTLNVGSNNSGGISAANITLAGGTANPYISIGQSGTAGSQGYDVDGIFIGNHDNSGTPSYRMSLKGGTNHIKWDGSNLDIKGSITLTGGPAASSLNSLNTTTGSLNQSVSSLNTETGSINTAVSNAQSGVNAINATSGALENPTSYAFGGNGFTLATNTASTGLNLTSDFLGYHDGSGFKTYMDNSGNFYLGGTSGALTWASATSTLNITGNLTLGTHNYWDTSGNFKVGDATDSIEWDGTTLEISGDLDASSGTITGATMIGGSIAVPSAASPTFEVTAGGVMSATGAVISGDVTATAGVIGGWTVGSSQLFSPSTTTNNRLTLNAGGAPSLSINNSSGVLATEINSNSTLSTSFGGSTPSLSATSLPKVGSIPASVTLSSGTNSYNRVDGQQTSGAPTSAVSFYDATNYITISNLANGSCTIEATQDSNATLAQGWHSLSSFGPNGIFNSVSGIVTVGFVVQTGTPANFGTGVVGYHEYTMLDAVSNNNTAHWPIAYAVTNNVGQINFTATSGTTYYLIPYNRRQNYGVQYPSAFANRTINFKTSTPATTSVSASQPVSRTEICAGGLQVVSSSSNYVIMERNTSATGAGSVMLSVGGSIEATGNITANASDKRLKDIKGLITNPLSKLKELNGVIYNWNNLAKNLAGYDISVDNVGLIAQDVQRVLPEAVARAPFDTVKDEEGKPVSSKSGKDYLTIWYERLVPLLVEGVKELTERVDMLEKENKKLKE
jgi:hypothetical protein